MLSYGALSAALWSRFRFEPGRFLKPPRALATTSLALPAGVKLRFAGL